MPSVSLDLALTSLSCAFAFLWFCSVAESAHSTAKSMQSIANNMATVAVYQREFADELARRNRAEWLSGQTPVCNSGCRCCENNNNNHQAQ